MDKVLCERPRGGWRGKRRSRIRGPFGAAGNPGDRMARLPWEDSPRFEPISRHRGGTKWLGEHLGPLRRWLIAQSGRPWDDVYGNLRAHISTRSAVQLHIWQHAEHYVARYVELVAGRPYHRVDAGWPFRPGEPVRSRQCPVYVCPHSGLVRRTPVVARKRAQPACGAAPPGPAGSC